MNEQIIKILPVELPYENIRENEDLELHFALGYNCGITDCAAAIEKATLVRCPTEKEIEECIIDVHRQEYDPLEKINLDMFNVHMIAKELLALLRGEK